MTNPDIIPPTPERLAKGDLENWKHTGRSMVQLNHDRLYNRGIIDEDQWKLCNLYRRMWEAFKNPLEVRAMRYGELPNKMSLEDWNIDRLTLSDRYQKTIQALEVKESRILSLVINDEQSFRNCAKIMAMRQTSARSLFYAGLYGLNKHLQGMQ